MCAQIFAQLFVRSGWVSRNVVCRIDVVCVEVLGKFKSDGGIDSGRELFLFTQQVGFCHDPECAKGERDRLDSLRGRAGDVTVLRRGIGSQYVALLIPQANTK